MRTDPGNPERYSASRGGNAVADAEREAFWQEIDAILASAGVTRRALFYGPSVSMSRETLEALARLHRKSTNPFRSAIFQVLQYPKLGRADRKWIARWLFDEFLRERDPNAIIRNAIATTLTQWVVPEMGEELIPLILDRSYGGSRSGLCDALVRTKHPHAAEVIASVIEEPGMAWSGLNGLGRLRATEYVLVVRRFLAHPSKTIRKEARTTLKKFGLPV